MPLTSTRARAAPQRQRGNRTAGFLTAAMTTIVAAQAAATDLTRPWEVVMACALLAIGLPTAFALWIAGRFEARLSAAVTASLTLGLEVLVATVGVPGGDGGQGDPRSAMAAALAVGVLSLLAVDLQAARHAAGRSHPERRDPPYAL